MKSFLLILLCFVCVAKSYGQWGQVVVEITKGKHRIYTAKVIQLVNSRADSSWATSIEKNLSQKIPIDKHAKRAKKGKYIVSVNFIIDKEGNVCDVECEKDPGFGMGAAVVREVKKSGKWGPAKAYKVRPFKS